MFPVQTNNETSFPNQSSRLYYHQTNSFNSSVSMESLFAIRQTPRRGVVSVDMSPCRRSGYVTPRIGKPLVIRPLLCSKRSYTFEHISPRAFRDKEDPANVSTGRLHREIENLVYELHRRDAQLQSSYNDQNELLRRLEQAHRDLEVAHLQAQELQNQNNSLRVHMEALIEESTGVHANSEEMSAEKIGRIAAERALASSKEFLDRALMDLREAVAERDYAHDELAAQKEKLSRLEQDVLLASRDAKDSLHREMEALADVELHKDTISALRSENEVLRTRLVELQAKMAFSRNKEQNDGPIYPDEAYVGTGDNEEYQGISMDGAHVAHHSEVAKEAKKRSYEIRAEAALLVETVEDRASELVEKAQREVAILKAALKKAKSASDDV